jgi:hypothetical protein
MKEMGMKKLICTVIVSLLLSACGSGVYQISKDEYQSKVQVLGVLPVLVDRTTSIAYPQREELFDLLERSASNRQGGLVAMLREKNGYFDVRDVSLDSALIGMSLLGERGYDETGLPTGYAFDTATVAELARRNVLDAVLIVVLSADRVTQTRRSRTKLETLHTQFEDVLATAAVIDRSGQVLWQMGGDEAFRMLMLQYPDFDEAYYNKTDLVRIKDISLAGIERGLTGEIDKQGILQQPEIYDSLFAQIVAGISPSLLDSLR